MAATSFRTPPGNAPSPERPARLITPTRAGTRPGEAPRPPAERNAAPRRSRPRRLSRAVADFIFGTHRGTDHLSQLDRLPLAACFRPDLEPGVRHRGDRLEPGGAIRRLERSAAVGCGCPARLLATFSETATDLEQTAAWRARPPEAKRRTGQRRQDGQQAFESAYAPARSVRQMPLPFSLNATSSTKWRITNSPRPNSRSMFSGRVGSGSRSVSKPLPSSTT